MITSQPRYLAGVLLIVIPLIIIFRSNISATYHNNATIKSISEWSKTASQRNNASNFQHDGILDETSEGAPKLAQVSMQYGDHFDLMYERGLRTHIDNGEKWGYPTHYLRHDIVGDGDIAKGVYDKLLYLLTIMVNEMTKNFGKRAEWIVWFDADTVLLNNNIPWTVFLPPSEGLFRDINMLVSRDWSGFNAGVFLIRVCEWSIHLLADAIALPRLRPEVELVFREQDALHWVFDQPENKKHRIYQPRHWFNVYDTYYEGRGEVVMNGSICVHFPGMGGARPDAMGRWLDKIDHKPDEVHVPLANTSYPAEIEAYWERLRTAADMLQRSKDYKKSVREDHEDIWATGEKKITEPMANAEKNLYDIIEEDAYDKDKLKQGVLDLDEAIKQGKKEVDWLIKKKEDDEKRKKEEEARKKEAEEKKKKEEAERKAQKELEKQTQQGTSQTGQGSSGQTQSQGQQKQGKTQSSKTDSSTSSKDNTIDVEDLADIDEEKSRA